MYKKKARLKHMHSEHKYELLNSHNFFSIEAHEKFIIYISNVA